MTPTTLKLSQIMLDGGTHARAKVNFKYVAELADAIKSGKTVAPLIVFFDSSKYWLADGFHRARAAIDAGASSIQAEVRPGGRREALLFSLKSVAAEEGYRTGSDKRRAVALLLADEEWRTWSNQTIAETLNVSPSFVATWRSRLAAKGGSQPTAEDEQAEPRRGGHKARQQRRIEQKLILSAEDLVKTSSAERCLIIDPYLASPAVLSDAIELLKAYYQHKTGHPYPDTQ